MHAQSDPSVRPMPLLCLNESSVFFNFFLVFEPKRRYKIFNGNPFSGGVKYTVVRKKCDFRLKSLFIVEAVRDGPTVNMDH